MTKPQEESVVKTIEVESVTERAKALGVKVPDGLCALPNGFFTADQAADLTYPAHTLDLKALFRADGQTLNVIEREGGKIPFVENRFDTWVGPALFFGAGVLTRNPELLKLTVQTIAAYAVELFKGAVGMKRVEFSYVVEGPDGKTHKTEYKGTVEQLPEILKFVEGTKK